MNPTLTIIRIAELEREVQDYKEENVKLLQTLQRMKRKGQNNENAHSKSKSPD